MSNLDALFAPRGIAVVGASRDPGKLGSVMARSIGAFPGSVVGINPRDPDPSARRWASVTDAVADTGTPVDLAVLCVPAAACTAALRSAADAGVRAALVCAGGFAEIGGDGARHQAELAEAAASSGVALLGPNTSGFLVPGRALWASFVPDAVHVPDGAVAVVAASGGVNHALAFALSDAGVGVSLAVGLGNAVDVGAPDVLRYLADDERTRAVLLHVESVADGPALVTAVRALTPRTPVIALVIGRADVGEFARSHTGALATSWRTTRAALRQAGAVLVDDEREAVDAAAALSCVRLPATSAPAIGVVSAQAGPALMHVDALRSAGIAVPPLSAATQQYLGTVLPPMTFQANPVDTGRPTAAFGEILQAVADDPAVDLVTSYTLLEPDAIDLAAVLDGSELPVIVGLGGGHDTVASQRDALHKQGVAVVVGPSALTAAARAVVEDSRLQWFGADDDAPPTSTPVPAGPLDEARAKRVLADLGVQVPDSRVCDDRAAAHRALAELGGPVAVKVLDAAVTHKTEIGGVRLGVDTPASLDAALDAFAAAGFDRVLVEAMAPPGLDLLVGATRDPVFGPVVAVGLGGVTAEALDDVAVGAAPIGVRRAARLADELAGRVLLDGFRGGPSVDRDRLGAVVAGIGQLLVDHPDLVAAEINPLRATSDGRLIALDAVIQRAHPEEEGS